MVQQAGEGAKQGKVNGTAAGDGSQSQTATPPSGTNPAPTGNPQVEVFTRAEMEEHANNMHSTLRKQLNDAHKWLGLGRMMAEELETVKTKLARSEEQRTSLENDQSKTDPDLFDVVQMRRDLDQRERQMQEQKRHNDLAALEHYDAIEIGKRWKRLEEVSQIAEEFSIKPEELMAQEFTSTEQLRAFAQGRAAGAAGGPGPAAPPQPKPDSGVGTGGIDWHNLTPQEKIRLGVELQNRS